MKKMILLPQCMASLAIALLTLLTSGCATPALLKQTAAHEWTPPATPDQLLTVTSTGRQHVIVVFRQSTVLGKQTQDRLVAWPLTHPVTDLAIGKRALRQLTNACDQVQSMPLYSSKSIPENVTSSPPGYAIINEPSGTFTVHLCGIPATPFVLPTSYEQCRKGLRLAGMPLALAADAAIVGLGVLAAGGGGVSR